MSVSIEQLRSLTTQLGFSYKDLELNTGAGLAVDVPVTGANGHNITLLVRSYDNGENFEAAAVNFISTELCRKSQYKGQFLFYLLNQAWETTFGTPEMDKDGEVRVLVEVPLVDAEMTVKQYERILKALTHLTVRIGLEGKEILENGEVKGGQVSEKASNPHEVMAMLIGMAGSASGREQLLKIIADEEYPEEFRKTAATILKAMASSPDTL